MRYIIFPTGIFLFVLCLFLQSCSTTKFVPEGEYLLTEAKTISDTKDISNWEMKTHISQKPNFKTFEIFKAPLAIYNLSGRNPSNKINKILQRAGEAPVIYDSTAIDKTVLELTKAMRNKGYLNVKIEPEVKLKQKKATVTYNILAGKPYLINDYEINLEDSIIRKTDTLSFVPASLLKKKIKKTGHNKFSIDSVLAYNTLLHNNAVYDLDMLDKERERITYFLRRTGYYAFNKEFIGFEADTTLGNQMIDLKLIIDPFLQRTQDTTKTTVSHLQYKVGRVDLYIDYNPIEIGNISNYVPTGTYDRDGYRIFYGERGRYITPGAVLEKCFIRPNSLYDEEMTAMTYSALSQLRILKNVNISYQEYWEADLPKLHCIITCVSDKRQGISTELEGTNSGGFFGIGAGLGYLHKNIFKGSELFNIGVRGAYEAITPNFSNFEDNYFEFGGEVSLTFPHLMFPFVSRDFRKNIQATTQFTANYTLQKRPGFFNRDVMAAGLKYVWHERNKPLTRHAIELVDVSYASISKLNRKFYSNLSESARRYSFDNLFIVSTGYTFSKTNGELRKNQQKPIYSVRASIETAGNVLALAAKLSNAKKGKEGSREIFGTQFAQYVRGTADYNKTHIIDEKNSFAWHVGGGLAYPYGNFKQIPIQKRFFSGGANNVRGWSVRELGPGSFYPVDKDKDNFFYHSGDIKFDANIEYRSKLFWILELGAFIDAGNIWTFKRYKEQEYGNIRLNRFYKEIAVAWGLGLRLDFDFVLIRIDCGWKAYDPARLPKGMNLPLKQPDKWPIKAPHKIAKNTAWHIAVGYPF